MNDIYSKLQPVDCIIVVVAQLIGIAPGQFVAVVAFTQLSESFQHANLRIARDHACELRAKREVRTW